jgi:CRP-like cAMP-binding protein
LEAGLPKSLLLQLGQRDVLSAEERNLLVGAFTSERVVPAGQVIVAQGDRPSYSQLLVDGLAGRDKVLASGARQITALHVPGDFMDLHGFLLKSLAHGVVALSTCRLFQVTHETLRRITETSPHLARLLWLNTLIDGSVHREWLVAMGRRPADGRLAHLICELFVRLRIVGRTNGFEFHLPLTQSEIADILGLSVVHVNRTLQSLRRRQLIRWDGDNLQIEDWDRMVRVAEFDSGYLCLDNEPR